MLNKNFTIYNNSILNLLSLLYSVNLNQMGNINLADIRAKVEPY